MKEKPNNSIAYIKTDRTRYLVNLIVSGLISFFLANIAYINFGRKINFMIIIIILFLFINLYRAGEYILTKKSVSVDFSFIFGDEETGKLARKSFIYYITISILFSLFIIFISIKYRY